MEDEFNLLPEEEQREKLKLTTEELRRLISPKKGQTTLGAF